MNGRLLALGVMCMAAAWPCHHASAASVTHTNVESFVTGKSDGIAVPIIERAIGATGPRNGGVMVMPQPGASVISDDLNYPDQAAAESAGWFFQLDPDPSLPATPTSTVNFTAVPGSMRLAVGRPQDFFNTGIPSQSHPVVAARTMPLDGDFMVETKITFPEPRQRERVHGIIIGTFNNEFAPIAMDGNFRYIAVGPDGPGAFGTAVRAYPTGDGEFPWNELSGTHNAQSYIVRVVKRGQYYYSFGRTSETEPWIFQQWIKAPEALLGDTFQPLVVGVYAKSYGDNNPVDNLQNMDVDYFRVNRLAPNLSGTYSNVLDAGVTASWRTISMLTQSMEGLKYQLRVGNTVDDGTLSDAGPFVGPDGTAATFYQEEGASVVPNTQAGRYLEYKLILDQTAANLPASVLSVSADYDPAALKTVFASNQAQWGPDGGGLAVQPGGGDLSLARTQVLMDDFSGSALGAGWTIRLDNENKETPSSVGLTERPGYLRLQVGYTQDIFVGGNDQGGVAALRTLPSGLTDFEVETEVNMESQQARQGGLHLWLDQNNFVGIALGRRGPNQYDIGVVGDVVLNDGMGFAPTSFYGSNTMQLRLAKVGQIITASYRDAASPSPGWHILYTINTTNAATGLVNFAPTQVALLSKSYGAAVRAPVNVDYNYLKVSSLATTGSKNFNLALPAGGKADALLIYGEASGPSAARFQINNVGPDGTAATYFTVNEPKLPASLAGITNAEVTAQLDGTTVAGVPYLHAAAILYAADGAAVARDTNRADFEAGVVKTGIDTTTTPGVISPVVNAGTPTIEDFNSQPANFVLSDLNLEGRPKATASYPSGNARLTVPRPVDTWGARGALDKERAFLYEDKIYTGDYEIEALLNLAEPPLTRRHGGIALVASRPAGSTVNDQIDMTNVLMFGPYFNPDVGPNMEMRFLRAENNGFGDFGALGWSGQKFYLRIRKLGNTFVGYAKMNEADPWVQVANTTHANLNNAYIGFLAKSWTDGPQDIQNYDFDYLKITPLSTSGTFESRALDLGATGLYPWMSSLAGNSAAVQVQWRAANSEAGLADAAYIGPDGTAATTFAGNFGGFLPSSLSGKRYFQYKAILPVNTTINDIAVAGLTTGPVSPLGNVITALRIAGGLQAATTAQVSSLDLVKGDSAGKVELVDAVAAARAALGL